MKAYKQLIERKYYKNWIQPTNPSGITATSGWENPTYAFDNNSNTYARCNSTSEYIEYNLGEEVYLTGINSNGIQIDSQAVATSLKINYFDSDNNEKLLVQTYRSSASGPYTNNAMFSPIKTSKVRIYITDTWNNAPSRTIQITFLGHIDGTSSDYDFYEDIFSYKGFQEDVRKYYKYVSWTQPVLTGYTTSTDLGNITVSATSDYGGNCQAWKIMIGSVSSITDNNYWQLANSNNQESLTLTFPYKLKISNLKITTRPRDNYTRSIGIFNNEGTQIGSTINCNTALTEYTVLSNGSAVTNTLTITVFAGSGDNTYFGLQNLQINAQRIEESTSSDYDFYEDITEYKAFKI